MADSEYRRRSKSTCTLAFVIVTTLVFAHLIPCLRFCFLLLDITAAFERILWAVST